MKLAQHRVVREIERSESLVFGGDCSEKIDKRADALLTTVVLVLWKPLRVGSVEITERIQTHLTSLHRGFSVPVVPALLESFVEFHQKKKIVRPNN